MKVIIAGFPGVGKSTAAMINGLQVKDMESSDFHWITDENGNKVPNPKWPENYTLAIIEAAYNDGCAAPLYIAISTHKVVLEELELRRIPFVVYAPETKEYAIGRYEARGSSPEFIKSIDEHWDEYMQDIHSYQAHCIQSDEYLGDYLSQPGIYKTLQGYMKDSEDALHMIWMKKNPGQGEYVFGQNNPNNEGDTNTNQE